jgi:hypothetical protein
VLHGRRVDADVRLLADGEASFSTHGTIKDGHPVPTTFTSKIVSDVETSDVTMVLDEGSVVCLDETSKQLIAETRVPISMKAGRPARFDYEYERNGTARRASADSYSPSGASMFRACPRRIPPKSQPGPS